MSLMVMKSYSAEFKADAVAQYLADPSHTFDGIGNDLGVNRETLDALIAQSETAFARARWSESSGSAPNSPPRDSRSPSPP